MWIENFPANTLRLTNLATQRLGWGGCLTFHLLPFPESCLLDREGHSFLASSFISLHHPQALPLTSLGVKIYFYITPLKTELPCQMWLREREHFSKGKRQPSTQGFLSASLRTQLLIWNAQTPLLSFSRACQGFSSSTSAKSHRDR